MSNLKTLVKSLKGGEVLLPALRDFLEAEQDRLKGKRDKDVVKIDARMTIAAFKERIEEFNHGTIIGEHFHPSQLGTCQRAMWFDHHHAPKKADDSEDLLRTHMIFETGTYVGVMFANLLERAGVLVKREAPTISRRYRILGHADAIVAVDSVQYVLELKTINSNNFRALRHEPKDAHKRQAHAYMKALGLKWAIILYLEKDRHAFREFVVPFSDAYYAEYVEARIDSWFKAVKRRTPPPKEGDSPMELPCKWCAFQRVCFGSKDLSLFLAKLNGSAGKIRMGR